MRKLLWRHLLFTYTHLLHVPLIFIVPICSNKRISTKFCHTFFNQAGSGRGKSGKALFLST